MATLRSLIVSLQARTEQFERSMQGAQRELRELRQETNAAQSPIQSLEGTLTGMAGRALAAYASFQTLKTGITAVAEAGQRMERVQVVFRQVAGGAEAGRREFGFVADTANRLGQDLFSLADGYKGLAASSRGTRLEGEATKGIFLAIVEAGRSLQMSQDQVQGALLAVQQMMSKGTVQAEELRGQLGERLPGAFQIAARAMGVSTSELGKMLEQGRVVADEFLPRFAAQLRKELGQSSGEVTQTASEQFTRFGNTITQVAANIAKDTGLLDWLGKVAGKVADIGQESLKARQRLEEMARVRSGQQLGAAGVTGLPDNAKARQELDEINRRILAQQERIAQLNSEIAKGMAGPNPEQLRQANQKALEALERQREAILKTIAAAQEKQKAFPLGEELSIDPTPFVAATEKSKALAESVQKILDTLQEAPNAMDAWTSETERLKEELARVKKAIEEVQKLAPQGMRRPGGGAPVELLPRISSAARTAGIDPKIFEALVWMESGYNPQARGKSGEIGLTQLMPATAKDLGVNPYDIGENLRGGATYLAQNLQRFGGDYRRALAAYNAGPGANPPPARSLQYANTILAKAGKLQGGAPTAGEPVVQEALAALGKRRAELEQQILTNTAVTKADTAAEEAAAAAAQKHSDHLNRLIESLKDGERAISEKEEAEIRAVISTLDADSATAKRLETLLAEGVAVRQAKEDWNEYKVALEEGKQRVQDMIEASREAQRIEDELAEERKRQTKDNIRAAHDDYLREQGRIQEQQEMLGRETLSLANGLVDALAKGGDAWEAFGKRVLDTILNIVIAQENLEQKLGEWLLNAVGGVVKLWGGGGTSLNTTTSLPAGDITAVDMSGFAAGMAGGSAVRGFAQAGKTYMVGEQGPELVTFGERAYVHNTQQTQAIMGQSMAAGYGQGNPVTVTLNVHGVQDAQSFVRSRAEVERSAIMAIRGAQRSV